MNFGALHIFLISYNNTPHQLYSFPTSCNVLNTIQLSSTHIDKTNTSFVQVKDNTIIITQNALTANCRWIYMNIFLYEFNSQYSTV